MSREIFNWVAINVQKNYLKTTFNISELFVLNNIFKNLLKIFEIKLNFFENNINEERLKLNMTLN